MPGGLIQIVAYGSQDLFLTSIPEITFFKFIYNRYTNFSMDFIELQVNGNKDFGQDVFCTIPKNGDLLNDLIVKIELPSVSLPKNIDNISDINNLNIIISNLEDQLTKYKIFIDHIFKCIDIGNKGILNINQTFDNIKVNINRYLNENKDYIISKSNISNDILNRFNIINELNNISSLNINENEKKIKLANLIESYLYSNKNILLKMMSE